MKGSRKPMTIAIDGSRAFLGQRTGIEEYSYRVILHLRAFLREEPVTLYVRSGQTVGFEVPGNWRVKELWAPRLWTQGRLSLQMLLDRPDVLFVPAHTVPVIHPYRTVVVVHGLEYEFLPRAYSGWERSYMRATIRHSVRVASDVICVSDNTRRDLVRLYGVPEAKIRTVYEGYDGPESGFRSLETGTRDLVSGPPFFLFIGRIEERKNVAGIVDAFERFRRRSDTPYRLVLAGRPGYGYDGIAALIRASEFRGDIFETGYVNEQEKYRLLAEAAAFVFPTFYEGFGLPILEAQAAGVPVIASDNSSIPEVAGNSALLVDPSDPESIARAMERMVSDHALRDDIIQKGRKNVVRFGWDACASEIADILRYGREHRKGWERETRGDRP